MLTTNSCHRRRITWNRVRWPFLQTGGLFVDGIIPTRLAFPLILWAMILGTYLHASPPDLPSASPEEAGMDSRQLAAIDRAVDEALASRKMPGCVVLIGRHGKIVFEKAFGLRQVQPEPLPMTCDTVFDLASLTKPVATATSVMILAERGKIRLEEPVAVYLPEFAANGKDKITALHLLTHQGGLIADNPLSDYRDGPEKARQRLWALKPVAPPGGKFIYSDVGYLVLGELVSRVSGQRLDQFAQENIFKPLGMHETGFLPSPELRRRAAPTEKRGDAWIQGEVHDPRAFALGGVAGHAGLFSTARDLARYAQMLLGRGAYGGVRVLQENTVVLMTTPQSIPGGLRGLGWDMRTGYSSNRGESFSPRAFGHGGFTGTAMWIDPELDLFVIFLSNRLHPDGKGAVNPLAGRIGTIAANAIVDRGPMALGDRNLGSMSGQTGQIDKTFSGQSPEKAVRPAGVLTGIDVLERDGFKQLQGRRVGLITNHTGVNRRGVSTAELLHRAPGVTLAAIFSPEHGLHGKLDIANIPDTRDPATGVIVHSLYGKTRKPTAAMLQGMDTLVFDIQDIGTRFYTYISTMGYAMQAAAEQRLRFVVLDRPNPINGRDVAGPVLDPGRESFVAFHRLPIRHGMTVGELATMFNQELKLGLALEVVRMEGWRREDYFDTTGLRWINPSPNMRSLRAAILYPGVGLLETTNLSVGRGTETPFELFGAPWLDGPRLAEALNRRNLPGVRFEPVEFTPNSSKFANEKCQGLRITITDRNALEPVRMGLAIACELRRNHPDAWAARDYDRLLGHAATLQALLDGKDLPEIEATWQVELEQFRQRRTLCLLY